MLGEILDQFNNVFSLEILQTILTPSPSLTLFLIKGHFIFLMLLGSLSVFTHHSCESCASSNEDWTQTQEVGVKCKKSALFLGQQWQMSSGTKGRCPLASGRSLGPHGAQRGKPGTVSGIPSSGGEDDLPIALLRSSVEMNWAFPRHSVRSSTLGRG